MITETYRRNLKRLRTEKGITQREFAEIVGLERKTIMKYETGIAFPRLDIAEDMASALGGEFLRMLTDGDEEREELRRKAALWDKVLEYARESASVGYTRIRIDYLLRLEGGNERADDDR